MVDNLHKKEKTYIAVTAEIIPDGVAIPRSFVSDDGEEFDIDSILNVQSLYDEVSDRQVKRYSCKAAGRNFIIFFEDRRWYMER
jgi:hypothetical protein